MLGFLTLVISVAVILPWRTLHDLDRCRRGYAAARTAADSLAVDRLPVEDRPPKGEGFRRQYCRATRTGPDLGPLFDRSPSGVRVP